MNMKHARVLAFLYGSSGSAMFSVLREQLFEPEALRILARGGDFPFDVCATPTERTATQRATSTCASRPASSSRLEV